MLPRQAREDIRTAISIGLGPEHAEPIVWVPIQHPQYSERALQPELRWKYDDYDEPDPPYVQIAMELSPSGIHEPAQSVDKQVDVRDISDGPQDADVATTKGSRVYDVLNFTITAEGGVSIGHSGQQVDYLSAAERAEWVTRAAYDHFLNGWDERPLDEFDEEGNRIDRYADLEFGDFEYGTAGDTGPLPLYGEDIRPPVLARPEPGREPDDVTEQVDRSSGSQWDAALRLHYFDTYVEYEYSPAEAEVSTQMDLS